MLPICRAANIKKPGAVVKALLEVLKFFGRKLDVLVTDNGLEFQGSKAKLHWSHHGMQRAATYSKCKVSTAERAIQTLKTPCADILRKSECM